MIQVNRIHDKFRFFWKEYQPKDLVIVCKSTLELMGIKVKGNGIDQVRKHWANVVNFLYNWEGKR